jgi:hypothetical protein
MSRLCPRLFSWTEPATFGTMCADVLVAIAFRPTQFQLCFWGEAAVAGE